MQATSVWIVRSICLVVLAMGASFVRAAETVLTEDFEQVEGKLPAGWEILPHAGEDATVTVVSPGAGESGHALQIVNDATLGRLDEQASLSYRLPEPADRIAIEFDLKCRSDRSSGAAFRLSTRGPDPLAASQVRMLVGGSSHFNQYGGILPGWSYTPLPGEGVNNKGPVTLGWYRVRIVADRDSTGIAIWISEPGQTQLPEKPTREVRAYGVGQSIASIHFGLAGLGENAYWIDNLTIRTGGDLHKPYSYPPEADRRDKSAPLWTGATFPRTFEEIAYPEGIEHHMVANIPEDWHWFHGPAIAMYKGRLHAVWGANRKGENGAGEIVVGARSGDGGRTWSDLATIAPGDGKGGAEFSHSHGTLLVHEGKLWGFFERWAGGWHNPLSVEAFTLDDDTGEWTSRGVVGKDGWPIDAPKRMDNGDWIMGVSGFSLFKPAVLVSRGDDLTKWETFEIPTPKDQRFPETSVIPSGDEVVAIIRRGRFAWTSTSGDNGRAWPEARESNYPNVAKPDSGVLSTGQWYIIGNMHDRNDLMISVGRPGEKGVSKVFKIRYGSPPEAGHPYAGGTLPQKYSYPGSFEHDGKLYVIYSVDKRDIELAIIPIASLSAP